jgi:hypothetical protein
VTALLPQADGICKELVGVELFKKKDGRLKIAAIIEAWDEGDLGKAMLHPLLVVLPIALNTDALGGRADMLASRRSRWWAWMSNPDSGARSRFGHGTRGYSRGETRVVPWPISAWARPRRLRGRVPSKQTRSDCASSLGGKPFDWNPTAVNANLIPRTAEGHPRGQVEVRSQVLP